MRQKTVDAQPANTATSLIMTLATPMKGLKEFANGDVALFGGILFGEHANVEGEEDFEAEFRRTLLADESISTHRTVPTDSVTGGISVSAMESGCTSPSSVAQLTRSEMGCTFEEDPLSALLNSQSHLGLATGTELASVLQPRKRGRRSRKETGSRDSELPVELMRFAPEISSTVRPDRLSRSQPRQSRQETRVLQHRDPPRRQSAPRHAMSHPSASAGGTIQIRQKRFENDLYSPVWVRGQGIDREGCCPQCRPQLWLKIKQSAYWYHMNFFHGISAATGRPYQAPLQYRCTPVSSRDSKQRSVYCVEALCGSCSDWIMLVSDFASMLPVTAMVVEEEIGLASWYRHAQKCHHRPKDLEIPSTVQQ